MFFKVLFIIVICLGIFLFSSWFFSCLYTEWQMDAAERARKKQEEELQVVKEQDPDGVEESSFIEETAINVEEVPQENKKNKKQSYNIPIQIGEGTLPSSQVLNQAFAQNEKKNKTNQKQNHMNQLQYQQLQQATQMMQQLPNLSMQEIQQHQLKQYHQQVAQQHQLEQQMKFIDMQQAQKLHQQLALQQQQQQAQQHQQINQASPSKNSKKIESVEIAQEQIQQSILEQHLLQSQAASNAVVINATSSVNVVVPEVVLAAEIIEEAQDANIVVVEKEIVEEIKKEAKKTDPKTESMDSQATQLNEEIEIAIEENLIQDKLPYRERKLEEYEFFKTAFEIIDLSNNIKEVNINNSYMLQFEDAISEADAVKTKIDWTLVTLLNANNHLTAIEELSVLLDQFLNSKFFKKINRVDKIQVIEQLLRSVLSIITKRLKCPAKNEDHQGDLLWIWNEIKDNLEREKERIKTPKTSSSNQNVNKPNLPPKPQKTYKPMNV